MAQPLGQHNRNMILALAGGAVAVILIVMLALGGGHNTGQPSAQGGPGNPMQTDQGR
jgi:hypothetical protein